MSLDQPASSQAFWQIYDACGLRCEYLIPVLSYESGLNPAVANAAGAAYIGIGQNATSYVQQLTGLSESEYLAQPASYQLSRVVLPYFLGITRQYGVLTSGVRCYQAEFYPASLQYALSANSIIVQAPSAAYEANAGFDRSRKGSITVNDLAVAITSQLPKASVQNAIAAAYQLRPSMRPPRDPVWGDRGWQLTPAMTAAVALGIVGSAAAIAYLLTPELFGGLPSLARENPSETLEEAMRVQSLLFPRDKWTKPEARDWLKEHGYKSRKVDETDRYYRFRQEDPAQFSVLRTKRFGEDIKAVVGR